MIAFQTRISIRRPIEEVFAYVSDPGNFPGWSSAVQVVRPTTAGRGDVGSTYSMERKLPTGRANNKLAIVVREHPREFAIRTIEGPTPFLYRYRFAAEDNETVVQLDAQVELPAVAALMPQVARRAVKHGIDDNLTALKLILEDRRRGLG
jgi:ligand-binding SRPBCC domain-containing protein